MHSRADVDNSPLFKLLRILTICPGKLAHDLRYESDTDTQSLTVMDNSRTVSAHKDRNLVVWNLVHGKLFSNQP